MEDTLQHVHRLKKELLEAYTWLEQIYVDCHNRKDLIDYTESKVIPYLEERQESHFFVKEQK